jgi:hypothetical protein
LSTLAGKGLNSKTKNGSSFGISLSSFLTSAVDRYLGAASRSGSSTKAQITQ